jgi:tetratricopeptide (TPR) repeat protein
LDWKLSRIHFVLTVLVLLGIIGQGCTPINPHDRSTLDHPKPELSPVLTEEQVLTDDEMEDLKYALDLAEYYYALGVNFNREGEWLEAQRNFEKSLEILSSIDVSADSNGTNQRFETLLEEIEQDYRFTLTSLGLLSDESSHGAFLELFSDIKNFKKLRETLPFRQVEKPESRELAGLSADCGPAAFRGLSRAHGKI